MNKDTQYLANDELYRLPECINAMANSSGGLIVLADGREIRVATSEHRPVALNGRVYRRIEGQNVICNRRSIAIMARDSQMRSCDDEPADDAVLDRRSLAEFREAVLTRNASMRQFTRGEFLRRTGVFSGKHITFAGALMFGEGLDIRAVLRHGDLHAEIEAHNIWRAYRDILPRLTRKLSARSSGQVHDAFVRAIFQADFSLDNHISISITSGPPKIEIDSPGIVRSSVRNHRLAKIFGLLGITPNPSHAEQDMLNFRAISTIDIEGTPAILL